MHDTETLACSTKVTEIFSVLATPSHTHWIVSLLHLLRENQKPTYKATVNVRSIKQCVQLSSSPLFHTSVEQLNLNTSLFLEWWASVHCFLLGPKLKLKKLILRIMEYHRASRINPSKDVVQSHAK